MQNFQQMKTLTSDVLVLQVPIHLSAYFNVSPNTEEQVQSPKPPECIPY